MENLNVPSNWKVLTLGVFQSIVWICIAPFGVFGHFCGPVQTAVSHLCGPVQTASVVSVLHIVVPALCIVVPALCIVVPAFFVCKSALIVVERADISVLAVLSVDLLLLSSLVISDWTSGVDNEVWTVSVLLLVTLDQMAGLVIK